MARFCKTLQNHNGCGRGVESNVRSAIDICWATDDAPVSRNGHYPKLKFVFVKYAQRKKEFPNSGHTYLGWITVSPGWGTAGSLLALGLKVAQFHGRARQI